MVEIREMKATDWDRVRAIYIQGLESGKATFQTECPTYSIWEACQRWKMKSLN